jgi:glycosyltransferase involved in cell wall biosynthesis
VPKSGACDGDAASTFALEASRTYRRSGILKSMKVLVSAYACEPGRGSEPGVGWNRVRQIARFHDVWVITRSKNRAVIEEALAKEPMPNVSWVYFDFPLWARFWKKGRRGIHLYYYLWQIGMYFAVRRLHRRVQFDLAHHVTFVNYSRPTLLPLLRVPFVWGPVGGGESAPLSFWCAFGMRGRIYEILRHCARKLGEFDPFVRLAARRATIALATTNQTEQRLRALGCQNVQITSEAGLPEEEIHELMAFPIRQCTPFRVLSLGNLLHLKGFELGLQAFARFHARFPQSEYCLVGDGPERKRLELMTRRLGLDGAVIFCGEVPRRQVFARLAESDVLLFPSLHDSGGWVCLEAMAAGRPVICLDLGGPGLQVTPETGIKVPAISPKQVVDDLAGAMCELAEDSDRRSGLGHAGRRRVQEVFSWEKKGEWMTHLYLGVQNGPH